MTHNMKKTIIHVNQHKIKKNSKTGERKPVLTCKTYNSNNYAHEAIIYGQDGKEAAKIINRWVAGLKSGLKQEMK